MVEAIHSTDGRPELSVVVLCYRAEELAREFVRQIVSELTEAGIDYELVLVANYWSNSSDHTPEIVKSIAAANPRCRVVAKAKEGMMGWDMRSGLEAASGEHICVIDGDGQMPSSDIVKAYRLLQVGHYDLAKTFRAQRFDGLYRRTISVLYNWLFRMLFRPRVKIRDVNSKPKVMTRAAFERMRLVSSDWFTDAEIMIEALRLNFKIGEVSTVFLKNERRASFVPPSAIWEFMRNLFHYRFRRRQP